MNIAHLPDEEEESPEEEAGNRGEQLSSSCEGRESCRTLMMNMESLHPTKSNAIGLMWIGQTA